MLCHQVCFHCNGHKRVDFRFFLTIFVIPHLFGRSTCHVIQAWVGAHWEGASRYIFTTILDTNLKKHTFKFDKPQQSTCQILMNFDYLSPEKLLLRFPLWKMCQHMFYSLSTYMKVGVVQIKDMSIKQMAGYKLVYDCEWVNEF